MNEIWAVLEYHEDILHEQSSELLSEAAEIAQRQLETTILSAVLLTTPETAIDPAWIAGLGVQRLYHLEHPLLASYATIPYVDALAWLIQKEQPRLLVTSATPNGRDWAPRLAAQLRLPFIPGCLACDLKSDTIVALRTLYEDRVYAQTQTSLRNHTAIVTFVPEVRGKPTIAPSARASLEITRLTPAIETTSAQRIRRIALIAPSPEEVELEAAERIVAGGRGVGQEGFSRLASFAHQLGAAVGATRVATDQGWIDHERQIGSTGKTVHPRLYIACGISGAAQHTSGMSEAQTVIAINPDRTAPIFAHADLGLLGDANKILPLASEMLEKRL